MSKTASEMLKEFSEDILEDMEQLYKLEPTSIKPSGVEYVNTGMANEHDLIMGMFDEEIRKQVGGVRDYNIGASNYATKKIQPWDIWLEYNLNPWDADIIKRVLRTKDGESRKLEYEKIIHICQERIRQLTE